MTNQFDSKGGEQNVGQGDHAIGQQNNYGVPYEAYGALAGKLAVTESALACFFRILEEEQVPLHDLDSKLREIAAQHKELLARVGGNQAAKQAIERGDYAKAETLLEDVADQHSMAAAEAHADNARLQEVQLRYAKAAAYWQKAAALLPEESKEERLLCLRDVLRPDGMLRITGSNLLFDRKDSGSHCLIEGTRGGSAVQSRIGTIANTEIVLMPDVPSQPDPWNNEYQLSLTTRYTKHGTLRTGTYERLLRSPLTLTNMGHPNPPEVGILTGSAASAHVSVTGGSVSADETLRIQVILDLRADALLFSLLDMQEGGKTGTAVTVTANGELTLQGFADSAVSSLTVRVNSFTALKEMLRNDYGGRVVDILQAQTA